VIRREHFFGSIFKHIGSYISMIKKTSYSSVFSHLYNLYNLGLKHTKLIGTYQFNNSEKSYLELI